MNELNKLNETLIAPVQDSMVNELIIENLLTKGKVTIEEAQFFNTLLENVLNKIFKPTIKQIEETIKLNTNSAGDATTSSTNEKVELNESNLIKLFLKK